MRRLLTPSIVIAVLSVDLTAQPVTHTDGAARETMVGTLLSVQGKTVEVVGLKRWTAAMIQDSMNRYAPGNSLTSHGCAAILRYKLGFAQAASMALRPTDGASYDFIAVIEPQDSALVRHRTLALDTNNSRASWTRLVELLRAKQGAVEAAVLTRVHARGSGLPPRVPSPMLSDSATLSEVWRLLDVHQRSEDASEARELLAKSPNRHDRLAAVAVLSSFDLDDATWWSLVAGVRESDGPIQAMAALTLGALRQSRPRRVDWRPARQDLHALLNGAGLFFLHEILETLVVTSASPDLAAPLLRGGGHAVMLYAGAAHPSVRGRAHRFLRAVSGLDLGGDVKAWRTWLAEL